jgi:hypothetical protein
VAGDMSNLIIIDRKHKRRNNDDQFNDPLGVEEAQKNNRNTIPIPAGSKNPIHLFIEKYGSHKMLYGKKCFALTDRKEIMSGYITKVIAPDMLYLKNKGVVKFSDCISLEE